jgi:phosphoglucomutase
LGGIAVEKTRDVKESITKYDDGRTEAVALPKSDVLQFYLSDGTVVSARPSGTEPKIKFYASSPTALGDGGLAAARKTSAAKLARIKADIEKALG